jgi:putative ABC transport system permease protein
MRRWYWRQAARLASGRSSTAEYRQNRANYAHRVVARLAPGVTRQQAQEEMDAIGAQLRAEFPVANRDHGVAVVPLHGELVQAAVRRFWPDEDPLGERVDIGSLEGESWFPPATVVGVVADVRNADLAEQAQPALYYPLEMGSGWTNMTFAVRTAGEPTGIMRAARDRVRAIAPAAPVFEERTAEEALARQVAPTRAILQLLGAFAGIGLAMAAVGVFGVLSYSVSRRTREIGIRTALGADSLRLISMVVGQAMARVLAGTVLGVTAAMAAGRLLTGLLYEVSPVNPLTIAGVTLILCLTALLAGYLPARRAVRVDPTVALRSD